MIAPLDDAQGSFLVDLSASKPVQHKAPYQKKSDTSRAAANRIAWVAKTDKGTCLREILDAHFRRAHTTRKMIAEKYFGGHQNKVTGRISELAEEGYVYEPPLIVNGQFQRSPTGRIQSKSFNGSALLKPTQKAIEFARTYLGEIVRG